MTLRSRVAAALFTVLLALAALVLVLASVHGASKLAAAAPVYFLAGTVVVWWVARRFGSVVVIVAAGCAMLGVAPGIIVGLDWLDRRTYERRIAATRIGDVRDELIVSASGHPIGIRLSYTVAVPERGYFAIVPYILAPEPRSERLRLDAGRWTIDGSSEPVPFEPGKTHQMMVELYPPMLFHARGTQCLSPSPIPPVPDAEAAAPLRVVIQESTYGNTYHGGREQSTRGAYDLGEIYRGVLAGGFKPCPSA